MEPGRVVQGRYRLERPLGAGGMGTVWAATHLVTHKAVALKLIHKKSDDPEARRRALREARAACAVRHPNVVDVHDVLEDDDGTPILVMDLLDGESLASRLERERTLPPEEVVRVARAVLGALAAAHEVGVVHRDLKPDNVFLLAGSGEVKILDFGVAKLGGATPATRESNKLTETGAMIGTPHYMAPEQAFGESDVDARADLWALGALLYECLAGVPPTDGQNLGQILKALATGTIAPVSRRAPGAPRALASLIDRLLKIERDERPASATVVLAELDAMGDLGAPAAPPRTRSRRLAALVAGLGLAIVASTAAIVRVGAPAAPMTPMPEPASVFTATVTSEPASPPAPPTASARPAHAPVVDTAATPASTGARRPSRAVATRATAAKSAEVPAPSAKSPLLDQPTF